MRRVQAKVLKLYELGYSEAQVQRASQAVVAFSDYLRGLVAVRRVEPQADLISALLRVEEQGQVLTEAELIANCIFLLNAGHEATVNATSLGLWSLFRNPAQKELLVAEARANPSTDSPLFKTAVEELLRFEMPLPMFERWVLDDFEYKGQFLRRGTQVALLYISGNRDPRRFAHVDVLDLTRPDNQHLTFGLGIHYCLGAPLARLELQVTFHELLRRFPNLHPLNDHVEFNPGFVIRGLKTLPVAF